MRYRFLTADVFTERLFGGNPLAVLPNATGIEAPVMQRIAAEFGRSETVFVLPPDDPRHTRRLRIFSPRTELPFAGHPTIGAAYVLARIGEVALTGVETPIVFEEGVGPVDVAIFWRDGTVAGARLKAARLPETGPPPPSLSAIAHVLSLDPHDLMAGDWRPEAVSCGVPFLFVPVSSREALRRVRVSRDRWHAVLAPYWAPSLYVFTFRADAPDASLAARAFAPALGVEEDPATGAAVTALGGYLAARDRTGDRTLRWRIEQGVDMGRPSRLDLEVDREGGRVTAIRVGGAAVLVADGEMDVS